METDKKISHKNQITLRIWNGHYDEKHMAPVEGFGGKEIIGYWDENTNYFYLISEEVLNSDIEQRIESYSGMIDMGYPLMINVTKTKLNNCYYTYLTFGQKDDRTIVYIEFENL